MDSKASHESLHGLAHVPSLQLLDWVADYGSEGGGAACNTSSEAGLSDVSQCDEEWLSFVHADADSSCSCLVDGGSALYLLSNRRKHSLVRRPAPLQRQMRQWNGVCRQGLLKYVKFCMWFCLHTYMVWKIWLLWILTS
jgi:hypothetical protein